MFVVGTVVVVAFGCVYVGVHYPSDVVVGAALGSVCAAVTWLITGVRPVGKVLNAWSAASRSGADASECQDARYSSELTSAST